MRKTFSKYEKMNIILKNLNCGRFKKFMGDGVYELGNAIKDKKGAYPLWIRTLEGD